jgi:predicted RND superfamily exporter protein
VQHGLWGLVRLVIVAPWVTVLVAGALAGVALWYTVTHLEFHTSRNAMVPQEARYMQRYRESREDFGDLEPLLVVVAPQHLERGQQFVAALAARLRADTQYFARVT